MEKLLLQKYRKRHDCNCHPATNMSGSFLGCTLIIADLHSSLDPKEVQRTNDISGISNILFPAIRTVAVFQQPIHSSSFQVHRTFHEISLPCFSDFSELPRHERDLDSRILDLSIESNSFYVSTLEIGLKVSRHFFNQLEVNTKPVVTGSLSNVFQRFMSHVFECICAKFWLVHGSACVLVITLV